MSRRFYLWLAAAGFVLVSALYVAQQWIPGPEDTAPTPATTQSAPAPGQASGQASGAASDTLQEEPRQDVARATERTSPRPAPAGNDPLVLIAITVAGVSLLAAGAAWWQAERSAETSSRARGLTGAPANAQVDAADRLAGCLAPAVRSASQLCQMVQMTAQLGEEAPEGLEAQVAEVREATADRRQQLETELMRAAAVLPNGLLQAGQNVNRMIESILEDERLAMMRGAELATQLQVAYYTFAGRVRAWAGTDPLDVERFLTGASADEDGEASDDESDGSDED